MTPAIATLELRADFSGLLAGFERLADGIADLGDAFKIAAAHARIARRAMKHLHKGFGRALLSLGFPAAAWARAKRAEREWLAHPPRARGLHRFEQLQWLQRNWRKVSTAPSRNRRAW